MHVRSMLIRDVNPQQAKGRALAVSLSAFSRDPPAATGCSEISTAAAETARGNAAVSKKTPLGPHVSMSEPEK